MSPKKEKFEIVQGMNESLREECPNCEGKLRQIKDWKLQCTWCGYEYSAESRNERLISYGFMLSVLVFAFGYLVATFT